MRKVSKINSRTLKILRRALKGFKPPKNLKVSEWADKYRELASESSAETGRWNTDRTPYLERIMNCISENHITEITLMFSAQTGKTEAILNTIGRYMHLDPCPIMVVQPTVDMAKAFSKDRIAPMIRVTKVLKDIVRDPRSRDSGNTVMQKIFPGGHITFVGANSPSSLASRPIRIVLSDEVDRFPESAGKEGDPLTLAEKRTTTFWNKKHVRVSTPTIKGNSKIEDLYNVSSKERWNLPCPSCGEFQPLEWDKVKWGENIEGIVMECETCGSLHTEKEWKSENQLNGKWIAEFPENPHKGFHLNELASPFRTWEDVRKDYLEAKGNPEKLKAWTNTSLGETWEEEIKDKIDYQALYDKRIPYPADLPNEVLILTAGVDVQDDRLEIEVVGWGLGERSYGIEYKKFYGNPAKDEVWEKLDGYLQKDFYYADGSHLNITNTCIDTGGHHTKKTYDFIAPRESKRVFGIKGRGGDGVPIINKPRKDKTNKIHLIPIGVNALKDLLFSRLKIESGPGTCYFPTNPDKNYDIKYFRSLTAEVKTFENGKIVWKQIRDRNEGIDLRDYATAAFTLLRVNLEKLSELRAKNNAGKIGRL
ncbi:terminase [Propionigenium maris DSM 9537]|uniref:Terminase n=1 Tax=Propionigenium maris DSM 9537 TaxID=1123000 RepID=A0A9W6LNW4_9FUSO|nr:phage terminase large subunit family protein [Propionigenium maris]GLI57349.1 terminase [Propionigenium maris DSM 9537]